MKIANTAALLAAVIAELRSTPVLPRAGRIKGRTPGTPGAFGGYRGCKVAIQQLRNLRRRLGVGEFA